MKGGKARLLFHRFFAFLLALRSFACFFFFFFFSAVAFLAAAVVGRGMGPSKGAVAFLLENMDNRGHSEPPLRQSLSPTMRLGVPCRQQAAAKSAISVDEGAHDLRDFTKGGNGSFFLFSIFFSLVPSSRSLVGCLFSFLRFLFSALGSPLPPCGDFCLRLVQNDRSCELEQNFCGHAYCAEGEHHGGKPGRKTPMCTRLERSCHPLATTHPTFNLGAPVSNGVANHTPPPAQPSTREHPSRTE